MISGSQTSVSFAAHCLIRTGYTWKTKAKYAWGLWYVIKTVYCGGGWLLGQWGGLLEIWGTLAVIWGCGSLSFLYCCSREFLVCALQSFVLLTFMLNLSVRRWPAPLTRQWIIQTRGMVFCNACTFEGDYLLLPVYFTYCNC